MTTITQFASLECKYGEAERGFTMFDKTLVEFPKRLDVLTVYTDMAVLTGDMDKARYFNFLLCFCGLWFCFKSCLLKKGIISTDDDLLDECLVTAALF